MASFPGLRTLCTLALCFQSTLSHMQMEEPSPLRDPHGNRDNEPKDFNILTPLRSDGSDFTCKGYQWNTPLTPVATYQAGETYEMTLKGGATHGGGSCQISLSCDNGLHFKVLKSIIGGCPTQKTYDFTIPRTVRSTRCLLGWSWFNRVGNREMYMNCAVVDIVGIGEHKGKEAAELVDRSSAAQAAQAALQILPDMYVANLQGINDCRTKETTEPVFPDPGEDVVYGKGV
ncbi:lytic polysaccharide monooxygenase, partial [Zopfia rhizophila CBS 207.26]